MQGRLSLLHLRAGARPGPDLRICRWTTCSRSRARGRRRSARKCCSRSVTNPSCDTRRAHSARSPRSRNDDLLSGRSGAHGAQRDGTAAAREPRLSHGIGSCRTAPRVDLARHHARERIGSSVRAGRAASRIAGQGASRAPGDDSDGRGAADSVHDWDPDRYRRDAPRAGRSAARVARAARDATVTFRKSSSRISARSSGRAWPARRPSSLDEHLWTIAIARLLFPAVDEHSGAAEPERRRAGPTHRSWHQ